MFNLTIICILLACITATFWVLEGIPAYSALNVQPEWKSGVKSLDNVSIAIKWLFHLISSSRWLIMDVFFTIVIVSIFHLGGLIGTTMGFAISNIISVSLLIARIKERSKL